MLFKLVVFEVCSTLLDTYTQTNVSNFIAYLADGKKKWRWGGELIHQNLNMSEGKCHARKHHLSHFVEEKMLGNFYRTKV